MQWVCKSFKELTLTEFHHILKLRIDVFVVEQYCAYHELDGKDQKAFHLFAFAEDDPERIIAYSRIFKPGDYYHEASFGRVVIHSDYRNQKIGYRLIVKTIAFISNTFDSPPIKISAQTYLRKFYTSFGFKQISDEYLEDGIPHIDMLRD